MNSEPVKVYIVDDDTEVTASLTWLLESVKITVAVYNTPSAFLQALRGEHGPACAVIDLRMPEMSGLELQQQLVSNGMDIPLMFLTAHGDVPAAVHAMQMGAIDFLQKPFNPQIFLTAVNRIARRARDIYCQRMEKSKLEGLLQSLSKREMDVLHAVYNGRTSKETARLLNVSPKTIDVHRANIMRKMGVPTATELTRLLVSLGYSG